MVLREAGGQIRLQGASGTVDGIEGPVRQTHRRRGENPGLGGDRRDVEGLVGLFDAFLGAGHRLEISTNDSTLTSASLTNHLPA